MEFFKDPITGEEYVKGEIRTTDFITTTKTARLPHARGNPAVCFFYIKVMVKRLLFIGVR